LSLSNKNINVGNAKVGQRKDAVIALTNTGNADLVINTITSSNSAFTAIPSSMTIAAGASGRDTIRFIPSKLGTDSARIIITSNAPSSPDTVLVSGFGATGLAFQNLNFGIVNAGIAKDVSIVLTNTGNVDVTISSISNQFINWTAVNTGLTNTKILTLAVNGNNIFAGTYGGGIYFSTNNGLNWTQVNSGLWNTFVSAIDLCGGNIYAGTYGSGVFVSTNNGLNWTAVNSGLTNPNVYSLAISGSNIFAGTLGGVFLSTNNGANWTAVNSGLVSLYIYTLAFSGSNIFAGTWSGIFLSTDNGTNWVPVNSGLKISGMENQNA
jgi:hypothetical protein